MPKPVGRVGVYCHHNRKHRKDRGAIEAALELGFPYGGLIPKGRLAEDGSVPAKFDKGIEK